MVFIARWIRNIAVGFAIYVVAVMSTGAVMAYGCISRIDETQVFDAAKRAYLNRLITTKKLADDGLRFIKCGPPQTVVDYFYGLPWVGSGVHSAPISKTVSLSLQRRFISMSAGELAFGNRSMRGSQNQCGK